MMEYLFAVLFSLLMLYLWVQHFLFTWAHDMMFLFLAGLVLPPVGIVHGAMVALGFV